MTRSRHLTGNDLNPLSLSYSPSPHSSATVTPRREKRSDGTDRVHCWDLTCRLGPRRGHSVPLEANNWYCTVRHAANSTVSRFPALFTAIECLRDLAVVDRDVVEDVLDLLWAVGRLSRRLIKTTRAGCLEKPGVERCIVHRAPGRLSRCQSQQPRITLSPVLTDGLFPGK